MRTTTRTKWYAALVGATLVAYWTVWPLRPGPAEDSFQYQCVTVKMGELAELEEGGLICIRGRKIISREVPPVPTRRA